MLRDLKNQVVVITGASSGIGHAAAREFARHGAKVVVGARRLDVIEDLAAEILRAGGEATAMQTDVSQRGQVENLAQTALNRFGRIDTWVNNAGTSVYATFDKLSEEEIRRIMDVNFMGTVHGIQAVLPIMQRQGTGTIINIASIAGKRALPLQSVYSASKFAIVGLGEALRAEMEHGWPEIKIATICPPSVNTAFFDNARTKEGYAARPMPPVYSTEKVVDAILRCAVNPQREVVIGAAGKLFVLWNRLAGGWMDRVMSRMGFDQQLTREPKAAGAPDNLFEASPHADEHGHWTRWGKRKPA
jgi:short-subunit dehydrogenase